MTDAELKTLAQWIFPDHKIDYAIGRINLMLNHADWCMWRELEEKVMKDSLIMCPYVKELTESCRDKEIIYPLLETDLPARCKALVSVLSTKDD